MSGEAVELSAYYGGDLAASGGAQGRGTAQTRGSFGVSGSLGLTRTRAGRVERKDGKIVVTITLTAEERGSLGATVGYGVASGGLEGSGSESRGRAFAFELNPGAPDYAARFNELRFATTLAQLQRFVAAHPALPEEPMRADTERAPRRLPLLGFPPLPGAP